MTNWKQHASTAAGLMTVIALILSFRSTEPRDQIPVSTRDNPVYSRPDVLRHDLPYTKAGMRVYTEARGDKTVLLLDRENERGIIVASTPIRSEEVRNGAFSGVSFSTSGRFMTYGLIFWEWGSMAIYDTVSKKTVLELPMGVGFFDTSEKYFYSCYYAGIDGSHDAAVYRTSDFTPVADLYALHPELYPNNDGTNPGYTEVQCGEDKNLNLIVFEFGEYDHMEGDRTIIAVKRRFILDTKTTKLAEIPL